MVQNRSEYRTGSRVIAAALLTQEVEWRMSLGARLKELRIRKNKSLQDVADAVKASKAHIWEIERGGSKNPTMDLLNKLAEVFGVSVSYLVGENPDETESELVAMYRDLRDMDPADREKMREIMKVFKGNKDSAE